MIIHDIRLLYSANNIYSIKISLSQNLAVYVK